MPNWCNNSLTVTGPEQEIKRFRDGIVKDDVEVENTDGEVEQVEIFNTYLPLPDSALETLDSGTTVFTDGGYDTALELWGTKWGDCETVMWADEPQFLEFSFTSAWSPPLKGLENLSKLFPELTFTLLYNESGNSFRGRGVVKNGEIVEDTYLDNLYLSADVLKEMGVGEDEQDAVEEMFYELYDDYVYNFDMTPEQLTKMVVERTRQQSA